MHKLINGQWTMQVCQECNGTGEREEPIFNSQPPDWRVVVCYECEGEGELMQPNDDDGGTHE